MLSGEGVQITLYGDDSDELAAAAQQVADLMAEVEGLEEIDAGLDNMAPELRVTVDKSKAMAQGLTVAQVYSELSAALTQETTALTLSDNGYDYEVVIREDPDSQLTRETLFDFHFTVESSSATGETEEKTVYLTDIARISEAEGFSSINRSNQSQIHTVSAAVADGYNIGLLSRELQQKLNSDLQLPNGYRWEKRGRGQHH